MQWVGWGLRASRSLCCGSRRGFGKSDLGQQFPWGNALPVSQSSLLSQEPSSASGPEQVLNKHLLNEGTNRTSNTSRHLHPGCWLTWRMVSGPILPQHIRAVSSKPLPTPSIRPSSLSPKPTSQALLFSWLSLKLPRLHLKLMIFYDWNYLSPENIQYLYNHWYN